MRRNARCPQPKVLIPRRGNSIVLVMGILVLLVIIATAYITRTQAGRVTSNVSVRATLRDDNARAISEMLAYEIGAALFPFPVDPDLAGVDQPENSNAPRLSQRPLDLDGDLVFEYFPVRYAVDPTFPYNFAPYHVVPFTNWPDTPPGSPPDQFWPDGPGNDGGGTGDPSLSAEGNPVGNPGFGDTRWLADHEPLRWTLTGNAIAFSHWRHMTNLARPNNGWRIVADISDVEDSMITNLSMPVEQWLVEKPVPDLLDLDALFNNLTGDTIYKGNFYARWFDWFQDYGTVYYDPQTVPPNFYNLSDLNANGNPLQDGERPQDEFIGGTPRWNVNRVLADTDGDGYTDSFWFLAPTMTERGIRQIVAARIVDNSAMLNVNVATRFNRATTIGATPTDLQLVGDITNGQYLNGLDVGFFDNQANWEINFPGYTGFPPTNEIGSPYNEAEVRWNVIRWDNDGERDFLSEIGVDDNSDFGSELASVGERLLYWQLSGLRPFYATGGLTPFALVDELELRMFQGQNYPWIISRLERAVNTNDNDYAFLRSPTNREESSEYLDQLNNAELAFDHRRNLTVYNGARNDEMPPWLWWRWDDVPPDVVAQGPDEEFEFRAETRRKLDLREVVDPLLPPTDRDFAYHLPLTLLRALLDGDEQRGTSYFGSYVSPADVLALENSRRAAAGMAANILEWRDDDSALELKDAQRLPGIESLIAEDSPRMLGMERQPFLVEAFIGHAYQAHLVEPGYLNSEDHIVHDELLHETIVVVQIANPFDTILDLSSFRLRVFDDGTGIRELILGALAVNSIDPGKARTFYAIVDDLNGDAFHDPWVAELSLGVGDTFANAENVTLSSTISTDRDDYDTGNEDRAIELLRFIPEIGGGDAAVVVDRIDIISENNTDVGVAVNDLIGSNPPDFVSPPPAFTDPLGTYPGLNIGSDTHWIEWVHVTRAWHEDFAVANGQIDFEERNPRYVFAERRTVASEDSYELVGGNVITGFAGESDFNGFDKDCDGCDERRFSMQMLQKDDDFEQVGELLNVWMFGHQLAFTGDIYLETEQTFAEFMIDDDLVTNSSTDPLVNRLRMEPTTVGATLGQVVGLADPTDPSPLQNPLHAVPTVPAAARVLDAFVCDDQGVDGNGGWYGNANGFTGKITPGLINVNTAGATVLRSAPHMTRLVHEDGDVTLNPFVRVPEAMIRYRERLGDPDDAMDLLPAYGNRGGTDFLGNADLDDLRGDRGFASVGELMLLTEPADVDVPPLGPKENWQIDFGGQDPFTTGQSSRISTDVNDLAGNSPDLVAKDAEELNLLFAGMSNMLSTRSDVFTVYFRVRSFIQNPTTRVWDATNPEFIVDDSRYVMLVDRSEVNDPNDKPKILYLEKLPK